MWKNDKGKAEANVVFGWTIGGNFMVKDEDEDAPLIELVFHDSRIRDAVIDPEPRADIASQLAEAMNSIPHIYEEED